MLTIRTFLFVGLPVLAMTLGVLAWAGQAKQRELAIDSNSPPRFPLVVHEWGTFTSFSGSDSVKLEFRPLVENDLPQFVLNRGRQAGLPNPFLKWNMNVLQRMETPVTYFYTNIPRRVRVSVEFPRGLLTEFYPPVETMQPPFELLKPEPVEKSLLSWGDIWLIPEHLLTPNIGDHRVEARLQPLVAQRLLPYCTLFDHYAYARQTDSALVYTERTADPKRPTAPVGDFMEKFLFYRGVGNFDLPIKLTSQGDGQFDLQNIGSEPIRKLFLVTVDGQELRFSMRPEIAQNASVKLEQAKSKATMDDLRAEVIKALVANGLYEKEALAMVNTWQASWFGEQGTRLFYLLPQSATDQLLPLRIEPRPDYVVRVMVGRLEIMTPEDEQRAIKLVDDSAKARAAATAEKREFELPATVVKLGRLAEPALVRVKSIAKQAETRAEAAQLLQDLNEYRTKQANVEQKPESS